VHSACRMPPGSRPPREAASANAASFTSPTLGSAIVERRAVGADPPHRASRTRARLEEPPKPSRPLSVAVAGKAPVSASSVVCAISWPRAHPLLRSRLRGIHLRGQSRVTHPGFRETHPVTRTPFRRIGSRALAALGLPESPSPHPSGCDPDEACACGLDQPVPPCLERRGEGPRTVFTRAPPGGLVRLPRFVRARSRVSAVRFSAHFHGASRPAVRPIDFCTPKPFHSSTRTSSIPSAATSSRARPFGSARKSLSSRSLAAPCSTTRTSSSRAAPPVRRRAVQAPSGSGPSDANETGGNRASRRASHFGARSTASEGVVFPRPRIDTGRL
jgi:hypothetical protein